VVQAGAIAVLLDTATGKTWVLQPRGPSGAVWVPARRLDSEQDVQKWRAEQQERGAEEKARREAEIRLHQAREARLRDELEKLRQEAQRQREAAIRAAQEAEQRLRELEKKAPMK
jgi:hypothetical protein